MIAFRSDDVPMLIFHVKEMMNTQAADDVTRAVRALTWARQYGQTRLLNGWTLS